MIRGTVEFVTKRESKFVCPNYRVYRVGKDRKKYYSTKSDNFEPNMWDYFKQKIEKNNHKLNPIIKDGLFKLLEPNWSADELGDGSYHTEFYRHFKGFCGGGICPVIMQSTFSLPQEVINHIQKEALPSFSKPINEQVNKIGKLMRKYIERDLKYIKQTHSW